MPQARTGPMLGRQTKSGARTTMPVSTTRSRGEARDAQNAPSRLRRHPHRLMVDGGPAGDARSAIVIRAVRPDDKSLLRRFFSGLSEEIRYERYHGVKRELTAGE